MKTSSPQRPRRFQLEIMAYGNSYYNERLLDLERSLTRRPRALQLDLFGVGELPPDAALRLRAILQSRPGRTRIITNAQSSLQNASVLVWLLGDDRLIRSDATVYFRRVDLGEIKFADPDAVWKEEEFDQVDSESGVDPEEGDYARVVQLIDDYLPVRELAGRIIRVPVLKQFGLVESERVDNFLSASFRKSDPVLTSR